MTESNSIIDWKRMWQLVSGIHHETPEDTVLEELTNVTKELIDGLLQFNKISSSKSNLEDLLKKKKQEKLLQFTQRLQDLLDLETNQCWEILCYYLANEYKGTASSLTVLISTETSMCKLLDDIWGYYTLERIIILKIVKNLLIFYDVPSHPYQKEYKKIVNKMGLDKLKDSYLKQLHHLIKENPPHKLKSGEFFNCHTKLIIWAERNAREIIEVVHILLLIFERQPVGLNEMQILFKCFKQHSFGRQFHYLDRMNAKHTEMLNRLSYSEIILFLKCIDCEDKFSSGLVGEIIETLEKDISHMYDKAENGPILLAWMLLYVRWTDAKEDEQKFKKSCLFGKRALDLNCFSYMRSMLTNHMFQDDSLVSRISRKVIYNLLNHMCNIFDNDGSCARHSNIYELLSELLLWPTIANDFCKREDGVRSLYNTLLESFPIDFVHLSMVASSLTKGGMGTFIKEQLESLPILTDIYDENKYHLRLVNGDEYIVLKSVRPYPCIDFQIPLGVSAVVLPRKTGYYIHLRTCTNYFNALHHEINCLLTDTTQMCGNFETSDRVKRVNEGLQYLVAVLQRTKSVRAISTAMVHPTEMCIDLLNKFSRVQNPPIILLANCLNVCTALLPLVDQEIFTRMINLGIFPELLKKSYDYKEYSDGFCFDSRLVGSYLVDVEKKREQFDFLLAYLRYLRGHTKLQRNYYFEIEIPGLIFVLRDVFSHVYCWRYNNIEERNEIYIEVMGFICDILDSVTSIDNNKTTENKEKYLLRDLCVYSLLNLENGLMLLRFVGFGNAFLQQTMEMESNWMHQQTHSNIVLVRLGIRILMQLLRLKKTIFNINDLSPLEALIYTQPKQRDSLRIIPVVTSYMNNIFDRWLPILSCRLIKRIALEFNMSLLACLDMEPDQIRLTFLQKLPDELESDSLKIAIIELVEACIAKQPGVTEAFFKVNFEQEKRIFGKDTQNKQIADSIVTYIEDYLEAVEDSSHTVVHPISTKIMNLIHTLWKYNMQALVLELIEKPNFWQKLTNPLFSKFQTNARAYTQLLNIIAIEIYRSTTEMNSELKSIVNKFFTANVFDKWLDFIFDMPKNVSYTIDSNTNVEIPEWLSRLEAFKGFLIIILRKQPQFIKIPPSLIKTLSEKCLRVLVVRSEYIDDLRPFILLSEMYLFVLLNQKSSYTMTANEGNEMLRLVIQLLGRIDSCYSDLHCRAKESCLAITIKCTELLAGELSNDSSVTLNFLHSVVNIICMELQNLENCIHSEMKDDTKIKQEEQSVNCSSNTALVLCLNLLKTIATIFHFDKGPINWDLPFITNKIFQRLLSCTGTILQLHSKRNLSIELLDVLIVFAEGNCSPEFLHCDVDDYLFLRLLPPKELLQKNFTYNQTNQGSWNVQEWWPIYARGIQFITILFQNHTNHFLKEMFQFVGIHQEFIIDSLNLAHQTLEPLAMNLIKSAITLIATLVCFEKQWRLEHPESMFNIMRSVQILMSFSISMFHQPRNLKSLLVGRRTSEEILFDSDNSGYIDKIIAALNNLSEIIILCVKSLHSFSPELIELICEPEFLVSRWNPLFEIHFGAPKICENSISLTFGTVLSIVNVYTKVLNLQNYGFHELPLNVLCYSSNEENNQSSPFTTTNDNLDSTASTTNREFSKCLSVASVTSLNCPSNELLADLDGNLCLIALQHILSLAASQSMLALKNTYLAQREKQMIKREISSELLSYHDFVKKKILIDHRDQKCLWSRHKHGQIYMEIGEESAGDENPGLFRPHLNADRNRKNLTDLRVNVVRRLHLQQQHKTPNLNKPIDFDMSHVISPIGNLESSQPMQQGYIASTPNLVRAPLRRPNDVTNCDTESIKRSNTNQEQTSHKKTDGYELDTDNSSPIKPKYTTLSYVQLVEEDYLHFMSNLFTIICQSE